MPSAEKQKLWRVRAEFAKTSRSRQFRIAVTRHIGKMLAYRRWTIRDSVEENTTHLNPADQPTLIANLFDSRRKKHPQSPRFK